MKAQIKIYLNGKQILRFSNFFNGINVPIKIVKKSFITKIENKILLYKTEISKLKRSISKSEVEFDILRIDLNEYAIRESNFKREKDDFEKYKIIIQEDLKKTIHSEYKERLKHIDGFREHWEQMYSIESEKLMELQKKHESLKRKLKIAPKNRIENGCKK